VTCPSDITQATVPGETTAVVNFAPTVSGGVAPVSVTCNPPSGSVFPVGTTTVTCTATDGNGASASCSFNVAVTAVPLPLTVTCPPDITQTTTPGESTAVVNFTPTVTGGVAPVSVTCNPLPGLSSQLERPPSPAPPPMETEPVPAARLLSSLGPRPATSY